MRRLMAIAVILALAWAGLWLAGRAALDRGIGRAVATELASGRLAAPPGIGIAGFPGRLDLSIDDIAYDDPESGLRFRGAGLEGGVALWRPWRFGVAATGRQSLTLAGGALALGAERLALGLALRPRPSLPLDLITVAGGGLRISGPAGAVDIAEAAAALGADPERRADYALSLTLHGIAPDAALAEVLAAPGDEAAGMRGTVALDLGLSLSAPLDRHVEATRPHLLAAELHGLRADLGALHLAAQGRVQAGADGLAEGRIELDIRGWALLPDLLAALGVIEPRLAPTLGRLLEAYAEKQAGEGAPGGALAIALRFRDGRTSLGPFPLGPAPRLAPRAPHLAP